MKKIRELPRTRFTASSHACLSSVAFPVLTLTISWRCDETTERGPTGRSDSGEVGGFKRVPLGLGVRVDLLGVAVESSVSDVRASFFERAMKGMV